jgi:hypothetical protein
VAAALTHAEAGAKGGRGKKAADNSRGFSDGPTSAARIVAKLKRDAPEIAEALCAFAVPTHDQYREAVAGHVERRLIAIVSIEDRSRTEPRSTQICVDLETATAAGPPPRLGRPVGSAFARGPATATEPTHAKRRGFTPARGLTLSPFRPRSVHKKLAHNLPIAAQRPTPSSGRSQRRPRAPPLPSGLAFGVAACDFVSSGNEVRAASSRASAAFSGSSRGACGNRSPSITPLSAATTAASSSSGKSTIGTPHP